jgi:hypothetical protein
MSLQDPKVHAGALENRLWPQVWPHLFKAKPNFHMI